VATKFNTKINRRLEKAQNSKKIRGRKSGQAMAGPAGPPNEWQLHDHRQTRNNTKPLLSSDILARWPIPLEIGAVTFLSAELISQRYSINTGQTVRRRVYLH